MRIFRWVRWVGIFSICLLVLSWSTGGFTQEEPAEGGGANTGAIQQKSPQQIIREFFELNKNKVGTDEEIETSEPVGKLKTNAVEALEILGDALSDEARTHRILAATLLRDFLKSLKSSKEVDTGISAFISAFETLKAKLMSAFQRKDPEFQALIYEAWSVHFQGKDLLEAASQGTPEVNFKTTFFFLHAGAMMLNPYTIKADDTGAYILKGSGEADTHFFIEAMYRNRYAWQDKELKGWRAMDYEMRLGIAGSDSDPSGAVVSGAGDAYMEFSIGKLVPVLNNISTSETEAVRWTFNIEGLAGFVTDKGAQDIHFYWGLGPLVAVGIPYIRTDDKGDNRKIEVLGGVYLGETDMPQFLDDNSREIESKNNLPKFKPETSFIWRGDIHFPFGGNGFVTITGRFISNKDKESVNPWNIAIGYTVPLEVITNSAVTLFKQ